MLCSIVGLQDGKSARVRSPRHQQQLLSPSRRHPSPLQFPDLSSIPNAPTKQCEALEERGVLALPLPGAEEVGGDGHTSSLPLPGAEEVSGGGHTSSVQTEDSAISMKTVGQSTSEHMSGDLEHMSCDHPDVSDIPSVQSIGSGRPDLPPVPNRLVPSKSTERILDILNQRGLGSDPSLSGEQKEVPLSSTPAVKSRDNIPSNDSSQVTNML